MHLDGDLPFILTGVINGIFAFLSLPAISAQDPAQNVSPLPPSTPVVSCPDTSGVDEGPVPRVGICYCCVIG